VESLALLATLIVLPSMFGGPISLLLTLWRFDSISLARRVVAIAVATLSMVVGLFLATGGISRGATLIGLSGITTGALAIWRATFLYVRRSL
jgi:hypothetical protein